MNKKIIIIGLVLLLAIAGLYGYNRFFGPDVEKGSKEITVEIVIEKEGIDAIKETFTFKTDTETVYALLVEKSDKLSPKFLDSDYGKMLIGIMGYEVDANSEYLRFDIGTEMSMTGVSDTPVKNGETYRFVLESF